MVAEVPHEEGEGLLSSVGLSPEQVPPPRERPEGSSNSALAQRVKECAGMRGTAAACDKCRHASLVNPKKRETSSSASGP